MPRGTSTEQTTGAEMTYRILDQRQPAPGFVATSTIAAYEALGLLHGRYRPLQSLLLYSAGRAELCRRIFDRRDLEIIDKLVLAMDLPGRGVLAERKLDSETRHWLLAYCKGFALGLRRPLLFVFAGIKIPPPKPEDIIAGLYLSGYLGLAQSQARMEEGILASMQNSADDRVRGLFEEGLNGFGREDLAKVATISQLSEEGGSSWLNRAGGSNAWAVSGKFSESGKPMLCGDPHLQINQLPGLFFEISARVADDYWLGATIPGLPGVALGRNRNLAWSGTFAVADNVDHFYEVDEACAAGSTQIEKHSVQHHRRFRASQTLSFERTSRGLISHRDGQGRSLERRWAADQGAHEAIAAYMRLPTCTSAAEAEKTLAGAHTMSLHFVLADKQDDIRYTQAGAIPARSEGWSGLYPVAAANSDKCWITVLRGADLPHSVGVDHLVQGEGDRPTPGMIVSANEARGVSEAQDYVLASLAQPHYRRTRIARLLRGRAKHTVLSMRRIQNDLFSLQAQHLLPYLLPYLRDADTAQCLRTWDLHCAAESRGAALFQRTYEAAVDAMASYCGGPTLAALVRETEARVWFSAAFDRLLQRSHDPAHSCPAGIDQAQLVAALDQGLKSIRGDGRTLGHMRRWRLPHMLLGGFPGAGRGPYALAGSTATVAQGNITRLMGNKVVVGPAYRMIADLANDDLWTAMPGGIEENPWQSTYCCWLQEYRDGEHHRLYPPDP